MAGARGGPRDGGGMADILYLLDRLEEVVTGASRLPLGSRVLVDEQEYLDIVDQIRLALPEEVKAARRVLAERDQTLAEAAERANQVIARAEQQAARRIDEHAIAEAAEERARAILERAEDEAQELRRQADDYAYRAFQSLQRRLRQLDGIVGDALLELGPRREPRSEE